MHELNSLMKSTCHLQVALYELTSFSLYRLYLLLSIILVTNLGVTSLNFKTSLVENYVLFLAYLFGRTTFLLILALACSLHCWWIFYMSDFFYLSERADPLPQHLLMNFDTP